MTFHLDPPVTPSPTHAWRHSGDSAGSSTIQGPCNFPYVLRIYEFTDLPPSLPLSSGTPQTRTTKSSYRPLTAPEWRGSARRAIFQSASASVPRRSRRIATYMQQKGVPRKRQPHDHAMPVSSLGSVETMIPTSAKAAPSAQTRSESEGRLAERSNAVVEREWCTHNSRRPSSIATSDTRRAS